MVRGTLVKGLEQPDIELLDTFEGDVRSPPLIPSLPKLLLGVYARGRSRLPARSFCPALLARERRGRPTRHTPAAPSARRSRPIRARADIRVGAARFPALPDDLGVR